MSLEKKINADFIQAMKDKDAVKKTVLSTVRSDLKNAAIELDKRDSGLDDADVLAVLKKNKKKLEDAIQQMEDAGRPELAEESKAELAVVAEYLPEAMSEAEVTTLVEEAIAETGAMNAKDMGKVMKAVLEKAAGRADNKIVSEMVRAKLS